MSVTNRNGRFATEGIRFARHNPDGTIPTPQRFLGFANTADVSKVVSNDEAELTIKIDALPAQAESVDFSNVPDLTQLTVQQAATALQGAGFTGVTFSADAKTGRLRGSAAGTGKIIQVIGPLAAALDFGQGIKHGGNGLEVISFFNDETISIGLPKDIKDKEEIDLEGAKGTITRMVIGAMLQGLSPVVTLKQKDYYLLEMIQGGKLNRESGTYDPPLSHESEHPTFWAEIFSAVYSAGTNKTSDVAAYERLLLRSMIGMEGDVPIEAKAWATYAFNLTATEYTDENDQQFPAWQEQSMRLEDFDALKVKNVSAA
jgi:hypothetical protein